MITALSIFILFGFGLLCFIFTRSTTRKVDATISLPSPSWGLLNNYSLLNRIVSEQIQADTNYSKILQVLGDILISHFPGIDFCYLIRTEADSFSMVRTSASAFIDSVEIRLRHSCLGLRTDSKQVLVNIPGDILDRFGFGHFYQAQLGADFECEGVPETWILAASSARSAWSIEKLRELSAVSDFLWESAVSIRQMRSGQEQLGGSLNVAPQLCHDLRAPLANLKAIFSLLAEELSSKDSLELVRIGQSSCASMKLLVDDLMEFIRGERGVRYYPISFDLKILVHEVCGEYEVVAQLKNLILQVEFLSEQTQVWADYQQIKRVFANLISNAIKYTDVGRVTVRVSNIRPNELLISVSDTGRGLGRDAKDFTSGMGLSEIQDSFGLGLVVVHQLLKINGSELSISSAPDQGSTFSYRLPLAA